LSLAVQTSKVFEDIGTGLLTSAVLVGLVWFRDVLLHRLAWAYRWTYSTVTRKRYVLMWIDDDRSHAQLLAKRLKMANPDRLSLRALRRPKTVLYFPRSPRRVQAIVLLDTDVSKLADDPKTAKRIEEHLREYVSRGGGIVGAHDLIYRRVRSEELQHVFGCKITNFQSYKHGSVPYRQAPEGVNHPVADGLPERFQLDDGEVCWGDWAPDVSVIYATDDEHARPLVVTREYAEGRVVWINSGDKAEWLCGSLSKPQPEVVKLLNNALAWVRTDD
jgi:type 1 glutamine amidotransferase